jgi:hypothetical protein
VSRHSHLVRRHHAATFPTQWLSVHCDYTAAPVVVPAPGQSLVLRGWACAGMVGRAGRYGPTRWWQGEDAASFWAALEARLAKGGVIWCISEDALLHWQLLGLWDRADRGAVLLAGRKEQSHGDSVGAGVPEVSGQHDGPHPGGERGRECGVRRLRPDNSRDNRAGGRGRQRRKEQWAALCVSGGGPTIVDAKCPGRAGRFRIVDAANYGLARLATPRRGVDSSARCIDFARRAVSTLADDAAGSWQPTAASQAMATWRHAHQTVLSLVDASVKASHLLEDCSYGGRCEAHRLGTIARTVYHLDVRCMYASCYQSQRLPVAPTAAGQSGLCPRTLNPERARRMAARVLLATTRPVYPVRDKRTQLTVWPVGTFETTLAGPELAYALRAGHVQAIERWVEYQCEPLLASYGDWVLGLIDRCSDDADMRAWAKQLAVSIVGKFCQRDLAWVNAPFPREHPWMGEWDVRRGDLVWEHWRSVAGITQKRICRGWSFHAMPAVAAWITSMARVELLRLIDRAGWEHTLYYDTDSLIVDAEGMKRLCMNGEVRPSVAGALQVKGVHREGYIYGIKAYTLDGVLTLAGRLPLPLPGAEMRSGSGGQARTSANLPPIRSILHGPEEVALPRRSEYRHGTVGRDGRVLPFVFHEGERV